MTWILLRGLTREARHWGGFTAQLAAHLSIPISPRSVTPIDLPGNGKFYKQASPLTVSDMLTFARQQMQSRRIKPPYNLLAMSLGGMVATQWAQHHPAEIGRLVLINTSMRPYSRMSERLRSANWADLGLLAARWSDADFAESTVHRLTCHQLGQQVDDLARWQQIRHTAPVSSQNAVRQLMAAARFRCEEAAPSCPVLLLSSSTDRLVNPVCSTQLAEAWQAEHSSHPWAGHDLPHDDPQWVCRQVMDWLAP